MRAILRVLALLSLWDADCARSSVHAHGLPSRERIFPSALDSPAALMGEAALAALCSYPEFFPFGPDCQRLRQALNATDIVDADLGALGFLGIDHGQQRIFVAFRGTHQMRQDLPVDLNAGLLREYFRPATANGTFIHPSRRKRMGVHGGFLMRARHIQQHTLAVLKSIGSQALATYEIVWTGHSMGAAMCLLIGWEAFASGQLPFARAPGGLTNGRSQFKFYLFGAPPVFTRGTAARLPFGHHNVLFLAATGDPVTRNYVKYEHVGLLVPVTEERMRTAYNCIKQPPGPLDYGAVRETIRKTPPIRPSSLAWLLNPFRHYFSEMHGMAQYALLSEDAFGAVQPKYQLQERGEIRERARRNAEDGMASRARLPRCDADVSGVGSCVSCSLLVRDEIKCRIIIAGGAAVQIISYFLACPPPIGPPLDPPAAGADQMSACMAGLLGSDPYLLAANAANLVEQVRTPDRFTPCRLALNQFSSFYAELGKHRPHLFHRLFTHRNLSMPEACRRHVLPKFYTDGRMRRRANDIQGATRMLQEAPQSGNATSAFYSIRAVHGGAALNPTEAYRQYDLKQVATCLRLRRHYYDCTHRRNSQHCPRICEEAIDTPAHPLVLCRWTTLCSRGWHVSFGRLTFSPESMAGLEGALVYYGTALDGYSWIGAGTRYYVAVFPPTPSSQNDTALFDEEKRMEPTGEQAAWAGYFDDDDDDDDLEPERYVSLARPSAGIVISGRARIEIVRRQ